MAERIKKEDTYQALREEGESKQKAAAIANAQANDSVDHDSRPYEQRRVDELKELARERDIRGRSTMNKSQLIKALRDD